MVRYLVFGGVNSGDYFAVADGSESFSAPERDTERISVPGRNGDLTLDNRRFLNVELKYTLYFRSTGRMEMYRQKILALPGYQRLEDSKRPEEYRTARLQSFSASVSGVENRSSSLELVFDCKPQRFLKSGERSIHFAESGMKIINPGMPSKPVITLTGEGEGSLTVGGVKVGLKETFSGLTLDCSAMNAFNGGENRNGDISAPEFPEIPPGESLVSWTGGVISADIVPGWWII